MIRHEMCESLSFAQSSIHFPQESPEEWTPVEQEFPRFLVWESEEPPYLVFCLHEKLQEIGQQLLEAYFNGQLEAGDQTLARLKLLKSSCAEDRDTCS